MRIESARFVDNLGQSNRMWRDIANKGVGVKCTKREIVYWKLKRVGRN